MGWIIASVPFWLLGGVFMLSGIVWMIDGRETTTDRAKYFMGSMLLSCPLLFIAAWIAS